MSGKSNHRGPRQPHPLNKKVDHTISNPQSYCNPKQSPRIRRTRPPENIERALSHILSSDGRGTSRPTTSHTRRHSPQINPSHSSSPDQTRNRIAIQNPRPILAQSPRNRRTKPSGNIEQGRGTGTASLSTSRHTTGPRAPRRGPRPLKGGTPHAHGSAQERPGRRSFQGRGTIPYGAPQSQRCSRNPATTEGEETEQWKIKN